MQAPSPPLDIDELRQRAFALSGQTLAELAERQGTKVPKTLLRHKGWIGQLLEWHLGCDAGNCSRPDFTALNIELKTLPLNGKLLPKESTYVCTAPQDLSALSQTWDTSPVRAKLQHVLFVPIEASPSIPIPARRVGRAIFWQMPANIENILRQDWEELMEMLHTGQIADLSAHFGTYLQIRPKAAHSQILSATLNERNQEIFNVPKGFYLRCAFTKLLLAHAEAIF